MALGETDSSLRDAVSYTEMGWVIWGCVRRIQEDGSHILTFLNNIRQTSPTSCCFLFLTSKYFSTAPCSQTGAAIALGYCLDDRGSRVRFPAEAGNFTLQHRVQNGSGAHSTSYPMGIGGSFNRNKATRARSWPSTSI